MMNRIHIAPDDASVCQDSQVRNRLLKITRSVVPYVRELRPYTGSVTACLLMQQLDYWFERYPQGFYKFLCPSPHELYKTGQSWTEELAFSKAEFRSAFAKIGVPYASKAEFMAAESTFVVMENGKPVEKFYASYIDRRQNLTYYFRNHKLVDRILDEITSCLPPDDSGQQMLTPPKYQLPKIKNRPESRAKSTHQQTAFPVNQQSEFTGNPESEPPGNAPPGNQQSKSPANRQSEPLQIQNQEVPYTDTTSENTYKKLLLPDSGKVGSSCGKLEKAEKTEKPDYCFPQSVLPEERERVMQLVNRSGLGSEETVQVLDELTALVEKGRIKVSLVSLAASLIDRFKAGIFMPAAGVEKAARRRRRQEEAARQAALEHTHAQTVKRETERSAKSSRPSREVAAAHLANLKSLLAIPRQRSLFAASGRFLN